MKRIVIAPGTLAFMVFCLRSVGKAQGTSPSQKQNATSSTTAQQRQAGEQRFRANCGRCHNTPDSLSPARGEGGTATHASQGHAEFGRRAANSEIPCALKNQTFHRGTFSMKFRAALSVGICFAAFWLCAALYGAQPGKTISITASRFNFEPKEITVKKGEAVTLVIQSKDVSHGLVIDDLGVRTEIKKGQAASVTFTPETVGTFEGKCAHFCGSGHGSMTLTVHVVE